MKYKIQFDLICPESDDDGDLIDPSCYDKDTIFSVIHPALYDQDSNWKLKNFKIKESK
tara:strand:+ start:399 stop:572 length:174 start_codon:yes stop_codon:yes gene_type:complete